MIRRYYCLLVFFTTINLPVVFSQPVDSTSFASNTRLSFYTFEKNAEILLHVPARFQFNNITAIVKINGDTLATWKGILSEKILRIPIELRLSPSDYKITTLISTPLTKTEIHNQL